MGGLSRHAAHIAINVAYIYECSPVSPVRQLPACRPLLAQSGPSCVGVRCAWARPSIVLQNSVLHNSPTARPSSHLPAHRTYSSLGNGNSYRLSPESSLRFTAQLRHPRRHVLASEVSDDRMRIIVHDFVGHPFQVHLSRALASRGHDVLHLYAANVQTPRGPLERRPGDAVNFAVDALDLGRPFEKYGLLRRRQQELRYGELLADRIASVRPNVVLSANTPLGAQARALAATQESGGRFVFWVQDLLSKGIASAVRDKLRIAGAPVARYYDRLEGHILRESDSVVAISSDFLPALRRWGVTDTRVHVISNWASLEELPARPRDNAWCREHGLDRAFCFLYSGTLGLKHRPQLLVRLAREFRDSSDVRIVIISEGLGADWIRAQVQALGLTNVLLLPFQPYGRLPDLLATADVLVAVLEEDAAAFSVPSKVLSYLSAARPILAAIPESNLAARLLRDAGAGIVVSPMAEDEFATAARRLYTSPEFRCELGGNGRRYAETEFDIVAISSAFERILRQTDATRANAYATRAVAERSVHHQ
jgi:colanic acid biosynthesis glycosyl transferase WcaI